MQKKRPRDDVDPDRFLTTFGKELRLAHLGPHRVVILTLVEILQIVI